MSGKFLNFISPSISIESLPLVGSKVGNHKVFSTSRWITVRFSLPDQLRIMTNFIVYDLVQLKKQLILINYFQWDDIHIIQENREIS
jgi:hypothetical protein